SDTKELPCPPPPKPTGLTCAPQPPPPVERWPTRWASKKRRASAFQPAIDDLLARELGLGLGHDLAIAPLVAGREVEDLEAADAGGSCQGARLASRQVVASRGLLAVVVEERGLAEEEVGPGGEPDDGGDVGGGEEGIHHGGDLLPRRDPEQRVPRLVKR